MKTASCKAKGRNLQKQVVDLILKTFPFLTTNDCSSRSMGAQGTDILLSEEALRVFPFACECKAQESLNIHSALAQAQENAGKYIPLLIFKRNRSDIFACLKFNDFLNIITQQRTTNDQTNS